MIARRINKHDLTREHERVHLASNSNRWHTEPPKAWMRSWEVRWLRSREGGRMLFVLEHYSWCAECIMGLEGTGILVLYTALRRGGCPFRVCCFAPYNSGWGVVFVLIKMILSRILVLHPSTKVNCPTKLKPRNSGIRKPQSEKFSTTPT